VWTVAQPAQPAREGAAAGEIDWQVAARSHAHARWAQFLAPAR
jgi:hypothetical protein